jgi:AGCS family alanine or glycine:cation symporter
MGNMAQIHSIASSFNNSLHINPSITGIVIAIIVSFIIVGGVNRIAKTTEKLVPYMSIFYLSLTMLVLLANIKNIPSSFSMIFSHAFNSTAATGGFAGSTMMFTIKSGVSRGVFANEAGLGSSPIAHAAADTNTPVSQAIWGIAEVFIDTILICSCTALVIISTGKWNSGLMGVDLTISAFSSVLPNLAPHAISLSIFFFAFSTLISWSYYGEKCLEFLVGSNRFNILYKLIYTGIIAIGATADLSFVWDVSDILNGLMVIPNLVGVLGLSGIVIKTTNDYFKKM